MGLSPAQQQVADSHARFRMLISGRRFGKTHLSLRELCKFARYPKRRVWYVAPYYGQAKEIAWLLLKEKLKALKWVTSDKYLNESALKATLRNGTIISLKGASNADSLRGVGIHFMVLDEVADFKDWVWREVLRPMLSDTGGHALFCGTPKGLNWVYEYYERGQDPDNKLWQSWQFTTLDGGNVPQSEIEEAREELDERTFRQEYLATFETYSGAIYYQFDRKQNVKKWDRPEPEKFKAIPLHIGMDFNINPMCASVWVTDGNTAHQMDDIVIYGSNTNEMAQEIRNRYPEHFIYVYPDPACRQLRTSANGNTDLSILQKPEYRFTVRARRSHALVRDRINAVNSRVCSIEGIRRLFIDPACKQSIKCIERQTYKEGTMIPDKESGFDHMNDATGYFVEWLWPISKADKVALRPMG